jgi:hypothetical protein
MPDGKLRDDALDGMSPIDQVAALMEHLVTREARIRQLYAENHDQANEIAALRRQNGDLVAANNRYLERARESERQFRGAQWHMHECEQIAGKALGYPAYVNDQKNFPGATEADGVCVGDHVADSVVEELAKAYLKGRPATLHPDIVRDVELFHKGCETVDPTSPVIPDEHKKQLRIKLITEEVVNELLPAIERDDIVGIADGIADGIYVMIGTALAYGLPFWAVWREVQRSNMDKFDPETGAAIRRADGKILKREGWAPPNIRQIIADAMAQGVDGDLAA